MKLNALADLRKLLPESSVPFPLPSDPTHDGKGKPVRIFLESRGKKGKVVTIIEGLRHNPATMKEIARLLKERCGTGGTVKNGTIELQGDQRVRVSAQLQKMHYPVKD